MPPKKVSLRQRPLVPSPVASCLPVPNVERPPRNDNLPFDPICSSRPTGLREAYPAGRMSSVFQVNSPIARGSRKWSGGLGPTVDWREGTLEESTSGGSDDTFGGDGAEWQVVVPKGRGRHVTRSGQSFRVSLDAPRLGSNVPLPSSHPSPSLPLPVPCASSTAGLGDASPSSLASETLPLGDVAPETNSSALSPLMNVVGDTEEEHVSVVHQPMTMQANKKKKTARPRLPLVVVPAPSAVNVVAENVNDDVEADSQDANADNGSVNMPDSTQPRSVGLDCLLRGSFGCTSSGFKDLFQHLKDVHDKKHSDPLPFLQMGFFLCDCNTPIRNMQSWLKHKSKSGCRATSCHGSIPKSTVRKSLHHSLSRANPSSLGPASGVSASGSSSLPLERDWFSDLLSSSLPAPVPSSLPSPSFSLSLPPSLPMTMPSTLPASLPSFFDDNVDPVVVPDPMPRVIPANAQPVSLAPIPIPVNARGNMEEGKEEEKEEDPIWMYWEDAPPDANVMEEAVEEALQVVEPAERVQVFSLKDLDTPEAIKRAHLALAQLRAPSGVLSKSCIKPFVTKVNALANNCLQDLCEKNLFLLLAFPAVALAAHVTNHKTALIRQRITAFPEVETPLPPCPSGRGNSDKYVQRCFRNGRISSAYSVLTAPRAEEPSHEDQLEQLEELHPSDPEGLFDKQGPAFSASVSPSDIGKCIRSLKLDSAPGPSGWTPYLVRLCLGAPLFLELLSVLATRIASNSAPGHDLLCASRLVTIPKPGGKIRPVAVGEMFLRIISKVLLSKLRVQDDLATFQFGVGSAGGCEVILHKLQELLAASDQVRDQVVVCLDFSNAFNSLSRASLSDGIYACNQSIYKAAKWLYNSHSPLLWSHNGMVTCLKSACGIRQGDPLAPYFFSMGMRRPLENLATWVKDNGGVTMAYLDDVVLVLPRDAALSFAEWKQSLWSRLDGFFNGHNGLKLNKSKSRVIGFQEAWSNGLELFGSIIGSPSSQSAFLEKKKSELSLVADILSDLPKQQAQILFRMCYLNQWNYLARTLDPGETARVWSALDTANRSFVAGLADLTHSALSSKSKSVIHLPSVFGGVGIPEFSVTAPCAYEASRGATTAFWDFVSRQHRLPAPSEIASTKQKYLVRERVKATVSSFLESLPRHECVVLADNASPIGRALWNLMPLTKDLEVNDSAYHRTVQYRLLHSSGAVCPRCSKDMNIFHSDDCVHTSQPIKLHDCLRDVCVSVVSVGLTRVQKEVQSADGSVRADFVAEGANAWNGGKNSADVTVVSLHSARATSTITSLERHENECAWSHANRCIGELIKKREDFKKLKFSEKFPFVFVPIVFLPSGSMNHDVGRWLKLPGFPYKVAAVLARARGMN